MTDSKNELRPTIKMALEKGAHYCAYQERSQQEVRKKLFSLKLDSEDVEEVIMLLIQNDFLNEERFAKTYSRSKFNQNKWGRKKIKEGLKQKNISERCIQYGLNEIDEEEYRDVLKTLLERKRNTIKDKNHWILKKKLLNYAIQKGFEYEIAQEMI